MQPLIFPVGQTVTRPDFSFDRIYEVQTQSLPIQAMATNITFHPGISPKTIASISLMNRDPGAVTPDERHELLGQRGLTIWLTGLSASGKVRR